MVRFTLLICVALTLCCGIQQPSAADVPYSAANIIDDALIFQHGPFPTGNSDPAPYGIVNNTADQGWIWNNGSNFTVDFGAATHVDGIQIYSTYTGGSRGANWKVERSDDNAKWSSAGKFEFKTTKGGGVNDAGEPETAGGGHGGWYNYDLDGGSAQYLKLSQTDITLGHAPRVGSITFSSSIPEPSTFLIATLGLLSLVGLSGRRSH